MTKHDTLHIHADGGSRGNPGPAAVGAVLKTPDGKKVEEISAYVGTATNNEAEYLAVIYGLHEAVFRKAKKVVLNLDSQLAARQLKGEYKVREETLKKFFEITLDLFRFFKKVEIKEVSREENKEADELVNKALNLKTLF